MFEGNKEGRWKKLAQVFIIFTRVISLDTCRLQEFSLIRPHLSYPIACSTFFFFHIVNERGSFALQVHSFESPRLIVSL